MSWELKIHKTNKGTDLFTFSFYIAELKLFFK